MKLLGRVLCGLLLIGGAWAYAAEEGTLHSFQRLPLADKFFA
jgi:hypothetical protein